MNKAEIHSKATRWCHRFHIQFPWKFTQLNVYHCFGFNDSFLHSQDMFLRFTRDCFNHGTHRVAELSATGHRWEVAKLWRTITGASRCRIQLTPQQTWRRVKTMFGKVQQKHKKIWFGNHSALCSNHFHDHPLSFHQFFDWWSSIFHAYFPYLFSMCFPCILGWSSWIFQRELRW